MGENAYYNGQLVKIGTCEDMMYLRAGQVELIAPAPNSVDVARYADAVRFRFPFPDEDHIEPGGFEDYDRNLPLWNVTAPEGTEHGDVIFHSNYPRKGFTTSRPCPYGPDADGKVRDVGAFPGAYQVALVQQRVWDGALVPVLECLGCSRRFRLPTFADAEPFIISLRSQADRLTRGYDADPAQSAMLQQVADRIVEGFTDPPAFARTKAAASA